MAMSRSFGGMSLTTRPPISTIPALGRSSPATMLSSVDLPHPDGPTSTVNSPLSMSRSIPFNTSRLAYRFDRPRMLNAAMMPPSFHGPCGEASQEIPSAKQIHQQRDQRGGDRLLPTRGKGDAIEELVPDPGKLEDHGHDQDRGRERQYDPPENPEEAGPVDSRRFQQVLGNTEIVVTAKQRRETHALDGMDQDQTGDGVHQREIAQHDHPGDQLHLFRQEDAKRHQPEYELIAAKTPERDRIAGKSAQQGGEDGGWDRQRQGIDHIGFDAPAMLGHAELVPGLAVVGKDQMARPADQRGGGDLPAGAQRVHDHHT